jgi:hypothetical protein
VITDRKLEQRRKALQHIAERKARIATLDWSKLMFDKQRGFIEGEGRIRVACCSRRAGKSHGIALALLKAAYKYPGSEPIYINLNRASAKSIIWPALKEINKALDLGLTFDNTHGHIGVPEVDSKIMVYGAGSKREIDKMRGIKPPCVALDEAQNMGSDIMYLLREVLLPATFDYKAPILITGTPSNSKHSPFYKMCHGEKLDGKTRTAKWPVYYWTMAENPYIPDVEEQYEEVIEFNGWNRNTPAFLREYKGLWVFDNERRIFNQPDSMFVNHVPWEDAADWRYILGVDLGTNDPCAFTVLAYSRSIGACYVVESYRKPGLDTDDAGAEIERIYKRYPPFSHTVVDSGGQGAAFIKRWKSSHPNIPARPVKKGADSVDMSISLINKDIRVGKLFFVSRGCEDLLQEMDTLQWDDKAAEVGRRAIKDGLEDHAMDSLRYAHSKVMLHDVKGWREDTTPKTPEDALRKHALEVKREELGRSMEEEPYWVQISKCRGPASRRR